MFAQPVQPIAAEDVSPSSPRWQSRAGKRHRRDCRAGARAVQRARRRYLKAIGDPREVVRDPEARYFGGRVDERSLVPWGEVRLGRIGFDEWLHRSQARA